MPDLISTKTCLGTFWHFAVFPRLTWPHSSTHARAPLVLLMQKDVFYKTILEITTPQENNCSEAMENSGPFPFNYRIPLLSSFLVKSFLIGTEMLSGRISGGFPSKALSEAQDWSARWRDAWWGTGRGERQGRLINTSSGLWDRGGRTEGLWCGTHTKRSLQSCAITATALCLKQRGRHYTQGAPCPAVEIQVLPSINPSFLSSICPSSIYQRFLHTACYAGW